MSKLATHGTNHKKGGIGGLARHNERMGDNHDNPDIDPTRTKDNFCLKKPTVSLYQDCKAEVERVRANGGRLRSDQNWLSEFTVYAPQEPLASKEEYERYFNTAFSFFAEKVGNENIKSAIVHMDEKTPHMHLDFMPLVRNEVGEPVKLSSKEVMTRKFLFSIQDELPLRLQEQGFNVQRGDKVKVEDKPLKGRSTKKYKADMEREKAVLDKQINRLLDVRHQLHTEIDLLAKQKDKLEDLVIKIEKKQKSIKKDVSYELKETGMFSNRKKRAVWLELEVLDKLLALDKQWGEMVELAKLTSDQNKVLREENSVLRNDLHNAVIKKKHLEEIIRFELPERDLNVLISENQERKDAKVKADFEKDFEKMDEKYKKPIVKTSVEQTQVVKAAATKAAAEQPKKKKPTAPSGGGDDR